MFQDRVIEAEEHAEEAIIGKEARIKEEVSLKKTAEDRTETVADKVRRRCHVNFGWTQFSRVDQPSGSGGRDGFPLRHRPQAM